jgi:acyl carrier protein
VLAESRDSPSSRHADYLIGFYVSDDPAVTEHVVRRALEEGLPSRLIPAMMIHVPDKFPVTINIKCDTKRLREAILNHGQNQSVAPRNSMEAQICQIWTKLLSTNCGVDDDFFKIGGDSILSLQLFSQVKHDLGMEVIAKDIFEYRTISRIVERVLKQQTSESRIQIEAEQGFSHWTG